MITVILTPHNSKINPKRMRKLFAGLQNNLSADQSNSSENYKKKSTNKPVGRYQKKVSVKIRFPIITIARKKKQEKMTVYFQ